MRKSGVATGATSLNGSDEEQKESSLIKLSPEKGRRPLMTAKNSEKKMVARSFVPLLNPADLDESGNNGLDDIDVNLEVSPNITGLSGSPVKKRSKQLLVGKEKSQSFLSQQLGPNDISAINNASTAQDTSMNMTHVELLRKLQPIANKQTFNYPGDGKTYSHIRDDESSVANFKLDNFDLQS